MGKTMDQKIFEYLVLQHDRQLKTVGYFDNKIAQITIINVLILSFIFDKLSLVIYKNIFIAGIILIFLSSVIGLVAYSTQKVRDSPSMIFYRKNKKIGKLKRLLCDDIDFNETVARKKELKVDRMLLITIIGIVCILVGTYV